MHRKKVAIKTLSIQFICSIALTVNAFFVAVVVSTIPSEFKFAMKAKKSEQENQNCNYL